MGTETPQPAAGRTLFGRQVFVTRFTGIADQILYSAVSFLQIAIYARLFDKDEFGIFSLALGVALVLVGIQRSALVIPMIVLFPTPEDFAGSGRWAGVQFQIACAVAVLLGLLSVVAFALNRADLGWLFALSALIATGQLLLDYQRSALYQLRKARSALLVSALYLAANLLGFAAVALWSRHALGAAIAAGSTAILAAAVARARRGPLRIGTAADRSRQHVRATIGWNMASFLPYTIYNNGMVLIVGALAGPAVAAVFAATRLFVAPVQLLTAAIDNTDKPRASRALATKGITGFIHSLRNTGMTLLLLGVPYLVAIAIAPDVFGSLLLGPRYAEDMWIARIWALMGVLILLGQPLESGLVLLGRSNWLFACRCVAALSTLIGAALLIPHFGAAGAVAALVGGWIFSTAQAWLGLRLQIEKVR